jgi:ABC-type dipeptide/oligopeptide/nickel transport system permease subunit
MRNYWWLWIPPGLTITLFVLGVSFFGDGLRDVLDPKQSRRGKKKKTNAGTGD